MSNILNSYPEFDQRNEIERERKYLVTCIEAVSLLQERAVPIEQMYLSHPSEPFSLRLRETTNNDGSQSFTATLKDRGKINENGLERIEIETSISESTYRYYQLLHPPCIRKLRAHLDPLVVVDYFEDGTVVLESEDDAVRDTVLALEQLGAIDVTGDDIANNEMRAHQNYRHRHDREAFEPLPELNIPSLVEELVETTSLRPFTVVAIAGRSGSGKSTVVRSIREHLRDKNVDCDVISTDDYHRGKSWLESHNNGAPWVDWDARIVYDLDQLKADIDSLAHGVPIARRRMDFSIEEPVDEGWIERPKLLIIEGIYAGNAELAEMTHKRYDLSTPLATCIGRRLLRDMRERPQFADPQKSLRYMLEYAEPAYNAQISE